MAEEWKISDAAHWWIKTQNAAVVPIAHGQKRPTLKDWPNLRLTVDELPQHFNGKPQNIGIILGVNGYVDVDLDSQESIMLAPYFLPKTQLIWGRESKRSSHWLYRCDPLPKTAQFYDVLDIEDPETGRKKKNVLVELRSLGLQTVAPPSVHESGEEVTFESAGEPTAWNADELHGCVSRLAAAALLARHWPGEGSRHHMALALSGGLINAGWSEENAAQFIEAVSRCAGDNETADRARTAEYSAKRIAGEKTAVGWPTVVRALGAAGDSIVNRAREWLGLSIDLNIRDEAAIEADKIAPAPSDFPQKLLQPPGLVGEICQWINETAIRAQPIITLGNTLAFMGAVVGRKVCTPTNLRTNLYCLGIAGSTSGKNHSRSQIEKLAESAGILDQVLGGEDVSSDSAVLRVASAHPSILFQFDEIGHFISAANSRNAQSHQRAIIPLFTRLFTSAHKNFLGKEYAAGEKKTIQQPNVCIYGTTVNSRLWSGLSAEDIRDGFIGRLLAFFSEDRSPPFQNRAIAPVPESIVNSIKFWWSRDDLPKAAGNIASVTQNIPFVVPFDEEAQSRWLVFQARCNEFQTACREETGLDAVWGRGAEHAAKVALIMACGVDVMPQVTGDVMAFAITLVEHLVGRLVRELVMSVASSEWERQINYVSLRFREAGSVGLTVSQLTRTTRSLTPKQRGDVVSYLKDTKEIVAVKRKSARGAAYETMVWGECER